MEKLRVKKLQEDADLELAKDAFGKSRWFFTFKKKKKNSNVKTPFSVCTAEGQIFPIGDAISIHIWWLFCAWITEAFALLLFWFLLLFRYISIVHTVDVTYWSLWFQIWISQLPVLYAVSCTVYVLSVMSDLKNKNCHLFIKQAEHKCLWSLCT